MTQPFNSLRINLKQSFGVHSVLLWSLIIILGIGIFFRFVNLDRKSYWGDEVFTSLQLSGYTRAEMIQELSNGRVTSLRDLRKFQHLNPDKTVADTIKTLA
jgi:uncharacterized membrane protein